MNKINFKFLVKNEKMFTVSTRTVLLSGMLFLLLVIGFSAFFSHVYSNVINDNSELRQELKKTKVLNAEQLKKLDSQKNLLSQKDIELEKKDEALKQMLELQKQTELHIKEMNNRFDLVSRNFAIYKAEVEKEKKKGVDNVDGKKTTVK